jgi:hypothetical protein
VVMEGGRVTHAGEVASVDAGAFSDLLAV